MHCRLLIRADHACCICQILDLEEIDVNLFRGHSPKRPRWGRIYGGQTVAQALVAAARTVSESFIVRLQLARFAVIS